VKQVLPACPQSYLKIFFAAYGGLFISIVARFCCRWQQNRATTETFANCRKQ
jgi:hypothetical protein